MQEILSSDQLLVGLKQRYAAKRFDITKKVPAATWNTLKQSLLLSPSSFGLQPWKFIAVSSESLKRELQPHCYNQPQVIECSHFVVFTHRTDMTSKDVDRLMQSIASSRKIPVSALEDYRQMIMGTLAAPGKDIGRWNSRQPYIALGQLMLSASLLGVDTCPMEGIESQGVDKILGLEGSGYTSIVACAVGYHSSDDSSFALSKVRFPIDDVVIDR